MTKGKGAEAAAETRRVMEARVHYENGFLPRSGGVEDQDYKTMLGIKIINQTVTEIKERDAADKANRGS